MLERFFMCVSASACAVWFPSEELDSPSSAKRYITDLLFFALFFRLQPAAYIKCLQATKILSSCLSKVKICFLPPPFVSSVHFPSPRLLLFHAALLDNTAGFRSYTTQYNSMCVAVKHFKAVPRLTFCWETSGCGFGGCTAWKGLFRETFSQWLRIMSSEIWKDTVSRTVSFLSSPLFRTWFYARTTSLWATTKEIDWAISNRK